MYTDLRIIGGSLQNIMNFNSVVVTLLLTVALGSLSAAPHPPACGAHLEPSPPSPSKPQDKSPEEIQVEGAVRDTLSRFFKTFEFETSGQPTQSGKYSQENSRRRVFVIFGKKMSLVAEKHYRDHMSFWAHDAQQVGHSGKTQGYRAITKQKESLFAALQWAKVDIIGIHSWLPDFAVPNKACANVSYRIYGKYLNSLGYGDYSWSWNEYFELRCDNSRWYITYNADHAPKRQR